MIATKYKAALLSLAAAGLLSTSVQAASVNGETKLTVNMPEILVLYHFDEIEIDLTGPAATAVPQTAALSVTAALGTNISTEADTLGASGAVNPLTSSNNMTVNIEGAWAVRSLSSANVSITGSIQNGTLAHESGTVGQEITVSGLTLSTNSVAPGWSLATGDMTFSLDLSGATAAGAYTTAGTDTFLLTLTGN